MQSTNSRRGMTSITHLMNFSLPPRPHSQQHHNYHPYNHRHSSRNPTWGIGSGYHAIDKARYVHANYRFIVRPDRNYNSQAVDSNVYLDWDAVLQILASADTQSASCPICLSTPVAPRMAKCGHIVCLPCLIRYMHSTDNLNPLPERRARWKKCPICEDNIYISETRPVRWFLGQEASMLREGGDVLLKLLVRETGSSLALPRDAMESFDQHDDIPWYHVADVMDYARFMKGGEAYMRAQYDDEITQLENLEEQDAIMWGEDTTWTRKAVASINDAKERLVGIGNPPEASKQPTERKTARSAAAMPQTSREISLTGGRHDSMLTGLSLFPTSRNPSRQFFMPGSAHHLAATDDIPEMVECAKRMGLDDANPSTDVGEKSSCSSNLPDPSPRRQTFYFYHALPNFFLSPLDIRILKTAFGNFSSFPSTLLPRIEHISTGHIVDDELRKRAKYMTHLPYGCEVSFLECDWTDVISATVLATFNNDLGRRRKRNHEKETREERERARAEREEDDKKWAAARRRRPNAVEKNIPETDLNLSLTSQDNFEVDHSPFPGDNNALASTPPWAATRMHSSFATLASPGTSPDAPRTVWGTAAVAPLSPPAEPSPKDNQPPDDGWLQGWEDDVLENDDAAAMVEANISGEPSSKARLAVGGARKKKNKKITLMSTNVRRGA